MILDEISMHADDPPSWPLAVAAEIFGKSGLGRPVIGSAGLGGRSDDGASCITGGGTIGPAAWLSRQRARSTTTGSSSG